MHAFTGTWRLVRLALRRDRVKQPIVLLLLGFMFMSSVAATVDLYGKSAQQQLTYAATTAPSVVSRVFGGPIDGPDIGAIVLNETFLFTALAVAFMSTLTVVRHTRQNEEFGRSELIESGIVSRHASLAAALIVTVLANVVFGGMTTLALLANDLPSSGSFATGAAMAAVGISFAAVAAVTAQLADSARGANSMAAACIGATFLLRAIGDSIGPLTNNGMSVQSAWPSWLSPIGWGQLIHGYTQANWWVFGLFGGLTCALLVLAIWCMARRDIGLGMIATKPGPAHAPKKLLSAFGLAKRLQRGILKGWLAAVLVLGISYGMVVKEFQDLLANNEEFQRALGEIGGSVTDAFLGILISFMAVTLAGYATQALLRMRSEESNGQLESVLGTSVSRTKWILSHVGFIVAGIVLLLLITAISMGVTFVLSTGEPWREVWSITEAMLVQGSAVFAFSGFVIAVFSLLPSLAVPIAWGTFAACLLVLQLGVLLDLPQWVINLSPFGHLPAMPAEKFELAPVVWLVGIGTLLAIVGLVNFNRRDISTT